MSRCVAGVGEQALLQRPEEIVGDGEPGRHLVTAVLEKQVGVSPQTGIHVESADASARGAADAVTLGEDHRGHAIAIGQVRRDEAEDSLVPVLPDEEQQAVGRRIELLRSNQLFRLSHQVVLCDLTIPVVVEENLGQILRLVSLLGDQE